MSIELSDCLRSSANAQGWKSFVQVGNLVGVDGFWHRVMPGGSGRPPHCEVSNDVEKNRETTEYTENAANTEWD
jgi:hypothetical protein